MTAISSLAYKDLRSYIDAADISASCAVSMAPIGIWNWAPSPK